MSGARQTERSLPSPATNMFLAYDTTETAQTALAIVDHVVFRLQTEMAVRTKLWRFTAGPPLEAADVKAQADAVEADVMIVAFGGSEALPDGLLEWVSKWASHRRNKQAALGAISTGPASRKSGSAMRELKDLARRFGLDFICHPNSSDTERVRPRWAASDGDREMPVSEWGINE